MNEMGKPGSCIAWQHCYLVLSHLRGYGRDRIVRFAALLPNVCLEQFSARFGMNANLQTNPTMRSSKILADVSQGLAADWIKPQKPVASHRVEALAGRDGASRG